MESTAAQEEAKSSPERKQRCWQELPDGDRSAPGNPAYGKGTPGLRSPLPAPGAGMWLSLCRLLLPLHRRRGAGVGQGSHPTCWGQGHGWRYAADGAKRQPSPVCVAWAGVTAPPQPAHSGHAPAPEQQTPRSGLHKVVPTKTMLLLCLFFFNDVDWHSSALWDQPRRLLMLSFLEHKGGVNGLTGESWLP